MKPFFLALLTSSLFAGGAFAEVKPATRSASDRAAPAVAPAERSSEIQPTGAGCTLLRPLSWNVTINACLEGATTQLPMVDGQEYTGYSIGGPLYGTGSITVRCVNGAITTVRKSCRGGAGVPQ